MASKKQPVEPTQEATIVQEKPKSKRGGRRPGAGRKPKWGGKTVVIRVPETMVAEIQAYIQARVDGMLSALEQPVNHADRASKSAPETMAAQETKQVSGVPAVEHPVETSLHAPIDLEAAGGSVILLQESPDARVQPIEPTSAPEAEPAIEAAPKPTKTPQPDPAPAPKASRSRKKAKPVINENQLTLFDLGF